MQLLDSALDSNMEDFISSGIYLAVEKMRQMTLRNLFKKLAIEIQANPELLPENMRSKPHLMHLDTPFKSLVKWDPELDMDELELILANLI